jgi:hypothetical protein
MVTGILSQMASTTDTFESVLDSARGSLSTAREEYEALEQTETVPSPVVESLAGFERELEELDKRLEVSEADVELAVRTRDRIVLLAEVLSALRERQRTVVETDVDRLRHQLRYLDTVGATADGMVLPGEIRRKCSMMQDLVENDRHDRIEGTDRLSISGIEAELRSKRFELWESVSPAEAVDSLSRLSTPLLNDIHRFLRELGAQNSDRTSFSPDLKTVKNLLSNATDAVDEDPNAALSDAATAIEGCLILHHSTARAFADQRVTETLAQVTRETGFAVSVDVDQYVASGDSQGLLDAVAEALTSEAEQSAAARLRHLLVEHDGSVRRTASATEFEPGTILEHVTELYADGTISDITIEFDQ